MTRISHQDFAIAQTLSLIDSYAFDLEGRNIDRLLEEWLNVYSSSWIRLATIEALYLGRYKIISIEHILNVWSRLANPNPHFTHEFERLICRKLPRHLIDYSDFQLAAISPNEKSSITKQEVKERAEEKSTAKDKDLQTSVTNSFEYKKPTTSLVSALGIADQNNWTKFAIANTPIHQFVPLPDVSSFFNKLKTFAAENKTG